jgi:hypothetical protein
MKLIWTYNYHANVGSKVGFHTEERRIIMMNYYILSIRAAKELGYYCIVYCDETYKYIFDSIADEVNLIHPEYKNSVLWDTYKLLALEDRTDDGEYCLIDGDLILKRKLPPFKHTLVFDSYEITNWNETYKNVVNQMAHHGIKDNVPEWSVERVPVISYGILYISNSKVKKLFVDRWQKCNELVHKHIDIMDTDRATLVNGQYLLTILANHYDIPTKQLTGRVGDDNDYYKHHCGSLKYNNPIVPTDHIIDFDAKKIVV